MNPVAVTCIGNEMTFKSRYCSYSIGSVIYGALMVRDHKCNALHLIILLGCPLQNYQNQPP